ncbi:hypothetical protein VTJ49DRAFT_4642 [Mycothermus thermophilus]|uniref:Gfo/Idh/MocA-like oxidoreductase N-terminal domain-containing protein n=1 Tax=Humicola insolens TaxID=85995 RepID=A0ABR3V598_HUMIN
MSSTASTNRIRVGLIGLSSGAKTAWASRAHLPYLLSPRGRSKYEIVALLNSSVTAAESAIKTYGLPQESTKAYGDPSSLAADPNVDLVVCSTRVDKHYETVLDSIRAGKDVFVEWPLAHDEKHARELADLAAKSNVSTIVGLQGVVAPVAKKVRELLEQQRIGKVLSSELRAFGGLNDRQVVPDGLVYFTDRGIGGNIYTIGFAHTLDLVLSVLGELATVSGDFHLQRPENTVKTAAGETSTVKSDVPDLIQLSGRWNESNITQKNATLHYRYRRGQPFPGEPAFEWTINGEKGELRIISQNNTHIQVGDSSTSRVIEIHDFEADDVEKIEWGWEDWQQDLPFPARGIGKLYDAFAEAKRTGEEGHYATFKHAAKRHEQLETLWAKWQA